MAPVDTIEGRGGFLVGNEELQDGGFELFGVKRFAGPGLKVMRDECVKLGLADKLLEVV